MHLTIDVNVRFPQVGNVLSARLDELHSLIINLKETLIMNHAEFAQGLVDLAAQLTVVGDGVTKVGTETAGLLDKITALEATITAGADVVPQSVVDAFNTVKAQALALSTSVAAVDALVPDAVPPAV